MKRRKYQLPTTVLGFGLSGVPLLSLSCWVGTYLGTFDLEEARIASTVGFFLGVGWMGICSTIAFILLLTNTWEEDTK